MKTRFLNGTLFDVIVCQIVEGNEIIKTTLPPYLIYDTDVNANEVWVFKDKNSGVQLGQVTVWEEMEYFYISDSDLRSTSGSTKVEVTFTNKNTFPVNVWWIDYQGQLSNISFKLVPGQSTTWTSYETHPFIAYESSTGSKVYSYIVNGTSQQTCEILTESRNSNVPVDITFQNNLSDDIVAYWLNYKGEEVAYSTIESDESYLQKTYAGHPWIFRDRSGGEIVGVLIASWEDMIFGINQQQSYEREPETMQAIENLRKSLVAYYPLRQDVTDASFNGLNATLEVGSIPIFTRNGPFGYGCDFSSQNTSFSIQLPNSPLSTGPYVLSAWFNASASTSGIAVVVGDLSYNPITKSLIYNFRWREPSGIVGSREIHTPDNSVEAGNWTNVIVSYDPSTQQLSIYINGVASISANIRTWIGSNQAFWPLEGVIGGGNGTNIFNGSISDVSFYNIVLNSQMCRVISNDGNRPQPMEEEVELLAIPILFLAIPVAICVAGIVYSNYYTSELESQGKALPSPNYKVNKKLPEYTRGKPFESIGILDVWGQGRVVTDGLTTGFKNSYNMDMKGQIVWNGPDEGTAIPNFIPVEDYDSGFGSDIIKDNSVKYITLMGAPIVKNVAASIARAINKSDGAVIVWGKENNEDDLVLLRNELLKVGFIQHTTYSMQEPFNEIVISQKNNVVAVFAPSAVTNPTLKYAG